MVVNGTVRSEDRRNEVPDEEMRGSRNRSEVPNVKCAVMRIRRRGVARRARERLVSALGGTPIVAIRWGRRMGWWGGGGWRLWLGHAGIVMSASERRKKGG